LKSRILAIGDVHGCSKTFAKLLFETLRILPSDEIYCLGDYIDRGHDSKGAIDLILELRANGFQIHTLRGNHEQMMMDSMMDEESLMIWLKMGGDRTLESFGINFYHQLSPHYIKFFNETKHFIKSGNFIFVHAGLNFQRPDIFEDTNAMLWIRDFKIDKNKLGDNLIIHGHNPRTLEFILSQQILNAVNIDGGCVFKDHGSYGFLVALDLTERKFIVEKNCE